MKTLFLFFVLLSTAQAQLTDYGFYLNRTNKNIKMYSNEQGDALVYIKQKTTHAFNPQKLNQKHLAPAYEMAKNYFGRAMFGFKKVKVEKLKVRSSIKNSSIVNIKGYLIDAKNIKRYFVERHYYIGKKNYFITYMSLEKIDKYPLVISKLGPSYLLKKRSVAEDSSTAAQESCTDCAIEEAAAEQVESSLEDSLQVARLANKDFCEDVPEEQKAPWLRRLGVSDNLITPAVPAAPVAIGAAACIEGGLYGIADLFTGLFDLGKMAKNGWVDFAEKQDIKGRYSDLLSDDGELGFFEFALGSARAAFEEAYGFADRIFSKDKDGDNYFERNRQKWDKLIAENPKDFEWMPMWFQNAVMSNVGFAYAAEAIEGGKMMLDMIGQLYDMAKSALTDQFEIFDVCLSADAKAKMVCRTVVHLIEMVGGLEVAVGKGISYMTRGNRMKNAIAEASRDFFKSPAPKEKFAEEISTPATVEALDQVPNSQWRRAPDGTQVLLQDGRLYARHRQVSSNGSPERLDRRNSPDANQSERGFYYSRLDYGRGSPYRRMNDPEKWDEFPGIGGPSSRSIYTWKRTGGQSAENYLRVLGRQNMASMSRRTIARAATRLEKQPAYAQRLGRLLDTINNNPDPKVVRQGNSVYKRMMRALAYSDDKALPSLDYLEQAIRRVQPRDKSNPAKSKLFDRRKLKDAVKGIRDGIPQPSYFRQAHELMNAISDDVYRWNRRRRERGLAPRSYADALEKRRQERAPAISKEQTNRCFLRKK